MSRTRLAICALLTVPIALLTSCPEREYWACPEVPYHPTGSAIADACECQDGVPLSCGSAWCDGPRALTCEDPAAVTLFFQTECDDCFIDPWADGSIGVQCDEYWP